MDCQFLKQPTVENDPVKTLNSTDVMSPMCRSFYYQGLYTSSKYSIKDTKYNICLKAVIKSPTV